MLETTTAWEIGPAEGPIGFTNGIFIVVGGTGVENHQVASPRIVGRAEADECRGRHRVGRHHDGAGLDLAAVGEDAQSLAHGAVHPQHVDTVLDGLLQAERELVRQRLHAQRGQGGQPLERAPAC